MTARHGETQEVRVRAGTAQGAAKRIILAKLCEVNGQLTTVGALIIRPVPYKPATYWSGVLTGWLTSPS